MNYAYDTENKMWQPRPLNKKGDLNTWKARMAAACPFPEIGMIVWLDKEYYSRTEQEYISESIGYKVIDIKENGEAIWQRGQVIRN